MKRAVLVLTLVLFGGRFALAQTATPQFDLFAGYSHLGNEGIGSSGWIASADWNWNQWVGVEGVVSGHYGSESLSDVSIIVPGVPSSISSREHNFDFGPIGTYRTKRYNVFTHLLFGVSHTNLDATGYQGSGDSSFSLAWGGGADYNINDRWAGRFLIDWLHTSFYGDGQNHGRISLGAVYRLGAR